MTLRDRLVVAVVALVGVLGAFWFLAVKPKRAEITTLNGEIAAKQKELDDATARVRVGLRARGRYEAAYATVAKLGQAVPASDSVPSLVFQLDTAASAAGVDFRSVALKPSDEASSTTSTSSSSSGSSSSSSSTTSTSSSSTPAPPTQAATSTLPPGASVGPAGFPTMPFTFVFDGSFFKMADFLRRLDRFVAAGGRTVRIGGRLLTVEGIALAPSRQGFPKVKATVRATAYLVPPAQGSTGGATAAGPSPTLTSSSGSSSTPPAATATPSVP